MSPTRKTFLAGIAVSPVAAMPLATSAADAAPSARLIVFYKTPADQAAFEKYYFGTHAPLASKLPGLRSYVVSTSPIYGADGSTSKAYSFYAELTFDTVDALKAALASSQGAVVVGDLKNFAQAGADISIVAVKTV